MGDVETGAGKVKAEAFVGFFLISSLISTVISWLLSSVLFSLHVFVFLTDIFL